MSVEEFLPRLIGPLIFFSPIFILISTILSGIFLYKIAKAQNFPYSFLVYIPIIQPFVIMNIAPGEYFEFYALKIRKKLINWGMVALFFLGQVLLIPLIFAPRLMIICVPLIVWTFNYKVAKDILDIYMTKNTGKHALLSAIIPFYKIYAYARVVKTMNGEIIEETNSFNMFSDTSKVKKQKTKKKKDIYSLNDEDIDKKYEL